MATAGMDRSRNPKPHCSWASNSFGERKPSPLKWWSDVYPRIVASFDEGIDADSPSDHTLVETTVEHA